MYSQLNKETFEQLVAVGNFRKPATTWIKGGKVLFVHTGEVRSAQVALSGERIAYVGDREPLVGPDTRIIDGESYTLVPGYIEPHAHPFQGYNPQTLADFAVTHGTTTLLHDDLMLFLHLNQEQMESVFEVLDHSPANNFWWARLDPQVRQAEVFRRFTPERLERTLAYPRVLQAGELTFWRDVIDGDPEMLNRMWGAVLSGKRIETHNPGSSADTLSAVAAAGASACHESISGLEVVTRVRLGYYAALRHSSIRPDLERLIQELMAAGFTAWDRVLFTTDGSPPFFLAGGLVDDCVRIAQRAGLSPAIAYRMATLNPATYYGLERDLGSIAPGRVADLLFLEDLNHPTPARVMVHGQMVAEAGRLTQLSGRVDWSKYGLGTLPMFSAPIRAEWLAVPENGEFIPVMEYTNAVITRVSMEPSTTAWSRGDPIAETGLMYAALLDRGGKWVANALVRGLGHFDALASTYSLTGDFVVFGTDLEQMASALQRVRSVGGGICLWENGELLYELRLPLLGTMSTEPMDWLIPATTRLVELLRERGYCHEDPIYSLLFLSATHLPFVRLTPQGLMEIKSGKVLLPARNLSGLASLNGHLK